MICEWFARCTNAVTILVEHVAFPQGVPTCDRCAARFDLKGVPLEG